jgi:hypothetical protein
MFPHGSTSDGEMGEERIFSFSLDLEANAYKEPEINVIVYFGMKQCA